MEGSLRLEKGVYLAEILQAEERQRALLVAVLQAGSSSWEAEDSLDELSRLAATAGLDAADRVLQARGRIDATFYIGKGKAAQLKSLARACRADLIVFDNDLSPAQMRNLEEAADMRILDRSGLILDIFARHARTRTAQIQVELAQLKYLLPRLTRMWDHLSRQAGGGAIRGMGAAGVRGPGETQLETDRRLIRNRIGGLTTKLRQIDRRLTTNRKGRGEAFKVALVGYTNAGKSTLMRAVSGASVLVQDQLFATLDSTTRTVDMDTGRSILLTDTVGFIKQLPQDLFASFRTTLEEALEADLLLHVVDMSHPYYEAQMEVVGKVLRELEIGDKPTLLVFNKIDQLEGDNWADRQRGGDREAVSVSALTGAGLDRLKEQIRKASLADSVTLDLHIPQREGRLLAQLHQQGEILEQDFQAEVVNLRVRLDKGWVGRWQLERFAVPS